jgi:cold shock CspA family protein
MTETGVVVFYDANANYGFIEPDNGGADLIFSLRPGEGAVTVGDVVVFERMAVPYVTQTGATAHRVRRMGFVAPMEQVSADV